MTEEGYNLGITLDIQGKPDEVIAAYRQAIHSDPDNADAYGNLGSVLMKQGNLEEAITFYRQALRLRPHPIDYCNLGMALHQQKKLDEAIAAYRQAVRLQPKWAEAHTELGVALIERQNWAEAIAAYQQANHIDPNNADGHFRLGTILQMQGKLDEAITAYKQTIRLNPNAPEAHYNLGGILLNQHNVDEAIIQFKQVIRINPDDAEVYYILGQALLRRHDPMRMTDAVEAADYFNRARDLAKAQGKIQLFERLNQVLPEQERSLTSNQVKSAPSIREADESSHRVQPNRHRTDNRQPASPTSEAHSNLTPLLIVIAIILGVFLFRSCILGTLTNPQKTQPPTQTVPRF